MKISIEHIMMTAGVTDEKHVPFIKDAVIHIVDDKIVYAGKQCDAPPFEPDQVINGKDRLAMPGLCNLHTHVPMNIMRSVGSDLALEDWLHKAIFPVEKCLTDDTVSAGTDLAILEMLRFGITSFNDMYMRTDAIAQSVADSGMRAMLSYGVVDFDESTNDLPPGIAFAEKWHGGAQGRIRVAIAPHSVSCTTMPLLQKVKKVVDEKGYTVHIHISETSTERQISLDRYGLSPAKYVDSLGLLEGSVIAAHCVWMDEEDIELFAKKGVVIAHNPVSNLKLASGIAPIAKMLDAGCKVTLGTDGVASNNNLNLWEEIKMMPLLQKGTMLDPTIVSPAQTFAAATSVGAKAMGFENLGLLKEGYQADLILVDIHNAHVEPMIDLESDLIYATQGSDVCLTMVAGKVLYQDGIYTTLDEKAVIARAVKESNALFERAQATKA